MEAHKVRATQVTPVIAEAAAPGWEGVSEPAGDRVFLVGQPAAAAAERVALRVSAGDPVCLAAAEEAEASELRVEAVPAAALRFAQRLLNCDS